MLEKFWGKKKGKTNVDIRIFKSEIHITITIFLIILLKYEQKTIEKKKVVSTKGSLSVTFQQSLSLAAKKNIAFSAPSCCIFCSPLACNADPIPRDRLESGQTIYI